MKINIFDPFVDGKTISSLECNKVNDLNDALVENNSLFIGNNPSSTTNSASYNLSLGTGALSNITTADKNTAVGTDALKNHTEGAENVALGYVALRDNTIGQWTRSQFFCNFCVKCRASTTQGGNAALDRSHARAHCATHGANCSTYRARGTGCHRWQSGPSRCND